MQEIQEVGEERQMTKTSSGFQAAEVEGTVLLLIMGGCPEVEAVAQRLRLAMAEHGMGEIGEAAEELQLRLAGATSLQGTAYPAVHQAWAVVGPLA